MTYILLAILALVSFSSIFFSTKAKYTLKQLNSLEYEYLMLYIQKIDTLPAIIESLEKAWVDHSDLEEIRSFHRKLLVTNKTSSYIIFGYNQELSQVLKTLMRISLSYRSLQQSGAFIHAREIFTSREKEMSSLRWNINTSIQSYELARKLEKFSLLSPLTHLEPKYTLR